MEPDEQGNGATGGQRSANHQQTVLETAGVGADQADDIGAKKSAQVAHGINQGDSRRGGGAGSRLVDPSSLPQFDPAECLQHVFL